MTFDDARERILEGTTALWHVVHCGPGGSGPSFRDRLTFGETDDEAPHVLHADFHHSVAVYKPDLCLSLGWGLTQEPDWQEPWLKKFSDPHAKSAFVDVFFCGTLVWRDVYVVVDGGRGSSLPDNRSDVRAALEGLGYGSDEIRTALNDLPDASESSELLREARRRLASGV